MSCLTRVLTATLFALTATLFAFAAGSVAERLYDTGQHVAAFSVLLALLMLVVYDVVATQ